jgi:hypothetical protein
VSDYDRLMNRLESTIDYILRADLPAVSDERRVTLVGHLTGAVIVTVMDHDREEVS